jgi:hypothetical protein
MERVSVSHSTLIHAEIGVVYDALTTSRGLDAWFTQGATVDPRPGGEIHFQWVDWGPEHITTQRMEVPVSSHPPLASSSNGIQTPDYAPRSINLQSIDGGTIVAFVNMACRHCLRAAGNDRCAAGWGGHLRC